MSEASWVWGLPLAPLTRAGAADAVMRLIEAGRPSYFITANTHYAMLSDRSPALREVNRKAAFLLADGAPLVWASRRSARPVPERVAGSDLVYDLCERAAGLGRRVFLLGGAEGVADEAARRLQTLYPALIIAGTACPAPGSLAGEGVGRLIAGIREARPDLLMVALGQPKGEFWIAEHLDELGVPACVQVGATLDFVAGRVKRAPRPIQRAGMEWAYRIYTDPARLAPRYARNALFLLGRIVGESGRGRPAIASGLGGARRPRGGRGSGRGSVFMRIDPKTLLLNAAFGRWGRTATIRDGYTILVPSPADMPFLLQYALEGLRHLDLKNFAQILVLGDGSVDDAALRRVVEQSGDDRVEMAAVGPVAHFFVHGMGRGGGEVANWAHWSMIVEGIRRARGAYIFLHDADAFFLEAGALERQYRACSDRGMVALGVTARNDPFFREQGRTIPGTWELMFSNRWARRHPPIDHKGRVRSTPSGPQTFDTMLYPQFIEADVDAVGVIDPPPQLVHFAGAITTYRTYRERAGRPVVDEIFRLLLLALLEDLAPGGPGRRTLPEVEELARGLTDPEAPVTYGSRVAVQEYPIFRRMVDDLCRSPVMRGDRASRIGLRLRPFDDHFAIHQADPELGSLIGHRRDGLG